MKILIFEYFLYNNHTAISWCHYDIVSIICPEIPDGTSVKICDNSVDCTKDSNKSPESYLVVKSSPKYKCNSRKAHRTIY